MTPAMPPARHPVWLRSCGIGCAWVFGFVILAVAAILAVTFRGCQREPPPAPFQHSERALMLVVLQYGLWRSGAQSTVRSEAGQDGAAGSNRQ
jgi:hypothetical protein